MKEHDVIRKVAMMYPYSCDRIYGRAPLGRDATQDERNCIAKKAIELFDASDASVEPDAHYRIKIALKKAKMAVLYP